MRWFNTVLSRGRYYYLIMAAFPINQVRTSFPALHDGFIFFDNAAGAQAPGPSWMLLPTTFFIAMSKEAAATSNPRKLIKP